MLMIPIFRLCPYKCVEMCFFNAGLGRVVHAGVLEMPTLHWGTMTKPCTLLRNTWKSAER